MPWQGWQHKLNRGESIPICVKEAYWVRFSPDHTINGLGEVRRVTPVLQRGIVAGVQMTPILGHFKKESVRVLYYRLRFEGKAEIHSLSDLVYKYIGFKPWVSWAYYLWIRERAKRNNAIVYEKSKSPQRKRGLGKMSQLLNSTTIQIPYQITSKVTPSEIQQGALRMNFKKIPGLPEFAISETGIVKRIENAPRANKDWCGFLRQPSKCNMGNPHYVFTVSRNPEKSRNIRVYQLVVDTHGKEIANRQTFNKQWTQETRDFVSKHNERLKEKVKRDRKKNQHTPIIYGREARGRAEDRFYYYNEVTGQEGYFRHVRVCDAEGCSTEFGTNLKHQHYCCTRCRKREYAKNNPPKTKEKKGYEENRWEQQARFEEAHRVHVSDPFGESIPNNPDMCPLG